ncbi:family S53 protease [Irpex lacteus]|nr:family S53 protease [Irpex lacteus]
MVSRFLVFSALFSLALAKPHARNLKVHEFLEQAPSGFVKTGAADADTQIKLRIALVQNNPNGLIDALYAVSSPDSATYGEHLSKEEVEKFVAPAQESVDAVNAWLKEVGVSATAISPAGDWLSVSIPVSKANELLDADFSVYKHTDTGKEAIRTLSYSIPKELDGHLDFVHPTITFPNPHGLRPVISSPATKAIRHEIDTVEPLATCSSSGITPSCVLSLYGIPSTLAKSSSNQLAVSGFIDQFANQADLTTFLKRFRTDLSSSTKFTLQTLDGGSNPQQGSEAGVEANLDIQYTVGIASGVPTTFISVGDNFQDGDLEGFLDIINFLLNESNPPQVLTTSYGQNENTISRSLANNLCNAYAQLGARGTSILFASGDGGVSGSQSSSCSKFVATFPSGCPFMTSVGATQLSGTSSETAADFSSGGFSNYFGTPSYQSSAVKSYLSAIGSTNSGKFNTSGRAYPDVSAIGTNLEIVVDGQLEGVDGTSCSSPIFASVVSLLNDQLISAGKSPLGFLNPFLYANPSAFHDVTSGSNPGCNTNGFSARTGWDPVTGLGTPNFAALKTAAGL